MRERVTVGVEREERWRDTVSSTSIREVIDKVHLSIGKGVSLSVICSIIGVPVMGVPDPDWSSFSLLGLSSFLGVGAWD